MAILEFPPVDIADEHGLLAVGGDLEVESLLLAYKSGIFPWPVEEDVLTWFAPPMRAILYLEDFHIAKSLKKAFRKEDYSFEVNKNFEEVVHCCAELQNRTGQSGTWITNQIIAGYINLHKAGHAHSIEVYEGKELVGGLYGVAIGKMFAGESMFYRKPNASKLALAWLVNHLRKAGCSWLDCQVMTPLLLSFGAREIERDLFMKLLNESIQSDIQLF